MEIRQLRYFAAVVRERNFTRAAAALHIAQPPLSRQIQELEDELGVTLLERTRPLRLTDAGRVFHEQALQILERMEQLASSTRRVGAHRKSVLSIGFVASTLYGGLPALVRKLRERLRDVEIQLVEMMSMQQLEALRTGRIDVGFGRIRINDPAVHRLVLAEEPLVAAIPPKTPLAGRRRDLRLRELARQPLVVYPKEPRPSFADTVLTLLADHGVVPTEVHEVRELQTALGLVAAGVGVCVIPASAQRMRPDLQYRPIVDEGATSPVIMSRRLNDASPQIALVAELAREIYAGSRQ
jgi:LysR family transcriptional regulator, benzoate and cis,cis-muconate-responsive activator of ben and cat genes